MSKKEYLHVEEIGFLSVFVVMVFVVSRKLCPIPSGVIICVKIMY
jgi:hypothetical protein